MTAIYPCPPFGLYRLPHTRSCEKYIQCFAGEAVERDCGPGLEYSQSAEKCMEPALAQCYRTSCPLYNDPAQLVYMPDLLECDKYYLCHDNEPIPYRCAEGLHWDEVREYCTSPAEAECFDYEIICNPVGSHSVPNPRFCNQYYYCLNGISYPANCPADLLFDHLANECRQPINANCYPGSIGTDS